MSKPITDTTKISSEERLLTALPGGILAQEARGQQELVASTQLPIHGLLGVDRPVFEAMGIKILDDVRCDDSLFCYVELPPGWKVIPTPGADSRWSDLVDATGVRRAMIFYKAAFYDRRASISLERTP